MRIENHQFIDGGTAVDLPRLPVAATVLAWRVPSEYRASGLFVSVVEPGKPREVPACSHGVPDFSGELPPHPQALRDAGLSRAIASLAEHRYGVETAGISVGGAQIKTDRESQAQLSAAYTSLKSGLIPNTDWKAANGFQTVTLAEIEPIAAAVAGHVRACFAAERAITARLERLGTAGDLAAFDIPAEFNTEYAAITSA